MTNLLCSIVVALVTNVTEQVPQIHVPVSPAPDFQHFQGGLFTVPAIYTYKSVDDPHAKEKTVITTCKEITTLKFDWNGPREVVQERVVWETREKLGLEWVNKGALPPPEPVRYLTNGPGTITFSTSTTNLFLRFATNSPNIEWSVE